MAHYESKHGIVSFPQENMYMNFTDLSNFKNMLPEDGKFDIEADFDSLKACVQGFSIGVRVNERTPYSKIGIASTESPVEFSAAFHFDSADAGKTDFSIELDANLNFIMKTMIGGKIQEALDKVVDSMVDISEGRTPDIPRDIMK